MEPEIAQQQAGVITREQALAAGLTADLIRSHLRSGRWGRIFRGVYLTSRGRAGRPSLLWAAVLRAGPGAMLSHHSAAELVGLIEKGPRLIHLTVPTERTPDPIAGVRIHRSSRAQRAVHPTRTPPQTRVEETVVDLTQVATSLDDAAGWLARAVGARLTTVDRLATAIADRPRMRWRRTLRSALRDIATGCHSLLELRYLRDVERAHGLPPGQRQVRDRSDGTTRYHDVRYRHRTTVELDGLAAHAEPFRDLARDNLTVSGGERVLRYGSRDIGRAPCRVAAQVVDVLRLGGWRGTPRRCARPGRAIS